MEGLSRLCLPYYGPWDRFILDRIKYIRPEILLAHTQHGWYGAIGQAISYLPKEWIAELQALGIKVAGYTTGGYEGTTRAKSAIASALKICKEMIELDGCDMVFIDECSPTPNMDYYTLLSEYVHSVGKKIWVNCGINEYSANYYTIGNVDYVNGREVPGYPLSEAQLQNGSKATVLYFGVSDLPTAINLIQYLYDHNIAYGYANPVEYGTIADYWEALADHFRDGVIPEPEEPPIEPLPAGDTIGRVGSIPIPSGGVNEYNLYLEIIKTSQPNLKVGDEVWVAATTTDFPDMLTGVPVLTGNLDKSLGWWTFKAVEATTPTEPPPDTEPPVTGCEELIAIAEVKAYDVGRAIGYGEGRVEERRELLAKIQTDLALIKDLIDKAVTKYGSMQ